MTPEQFVYWLQGCLEITDPKQLSEKEIQVIKDHIKLVLKKETPVRDLPTLSPLFDQGVTTPIGPYQPGNPVPRSCPKSPLGLGKCGDSACIFCGIGTAITC